MSANLYASVSELKDRLGITDSERDFALDRCLEAASRWIDRSLGTRFYTTGLSEVRYYSITSCGWRIDLDDLLSLTELATDANNDGTYETLWTSGVDYRLGPINAAVKGEPYRYVEMIWHSGRFSSAYEYAIRVTSTAFGYCTSANCPPGIRELALMVAEQQAFNVLDTTLPGVQTYKLGNELTVTMDSNNLPPAAKALLKQFQPAGMFIN